MEKSFVYALYSKKLDRFYTGVTTLTVEERLEKHIQKHYGKLNFTQKADDWQLFWYLECNSFKQARNIELHIKKMKSRVYIQNLKKYPEIGDKLLLRYINL
ncbi:MAG: GIY-YIG nuclease family protein [Lunatimonas sp.]|uniref:GIY-YIG nuclease family protein n=1 Tax=Lunatimonas sp. TaxID=2060141 RepID=UPI002A3AA4CF|nr:GIY-YIG nuclease family protein [Lunatimonas sp.]